MIVRRDSWWDESARAHRDACRCGWRARLAPPPNLGHPAGPPPSALRRTAASAAALAGGRCTGWPDDCREDRPARHSAMARKCRPAFAPLRFAPSVVVASGLDAEQFGRGAAENVGLLVVA